MPAGSACAYFCSLTAADEGSCEMVVHLAAIDYIAFSGSIERNGAHAPTVR